MVSIPSKSLRSPACGDLFFRYLNDLRTGRSGTSYLLDVTGSGDTPMSVRVPNALLECLLSL
jgi:hypothetical protein